MTTNLIRRASRQMIRATMRGDVEAAFKWTFVIESQLGIMDWIARFDDGDPRLKRFRNAVAELRIALLTQPDRSARHEKEKAARKMGTNAKPDSP